MIIYDKFWRHCVYDIYNLKLLVRAVGTNNVSMVLSGLRKYNFDFFMAIEYKDDVNFYVRDKDFDYISNIIKSFCIGKVYANAINSNDTRSAF